jgi:hypothetical protein
MKAVKALQEAMERIETLEQPLTTSQLKQHQLQPGLPLRARSPLL